MTQTIVIKQPTQQMIQILDSLREKKHQQAKKLAEKKECLFSVKV